MSFPLNLYHDFVSEPMLKSKQALVFELQAVNAALTAAPSCVTLTNAVRYIKANKLAILNQFGMCAWTYAICQQEPALTWGRAVEFTLKALEGVLQRKQYMQGFLCEYNVDEVNEWSIALDAWQKFYTAVATGCAARSPDGHMGARYVIRQTPDVPPYFGRTICMPTTTPAKITERSYSSQMECEMALVQLPPQQEAVPVKGDVFCNEFGCYQVPGWGPKPPFQFDCAASGFCCGSDCGSSVLKPDMPFTADDQYKFYY
jgi:hypothetical protein